MNTAFCQRKLLFSDLVPAIAIRRTALDLRLFGVKRSAGRAETNTLPIRSAACRKCSPSAAKSPVTHRMPGFRCDRYRLRSEPALSLAYRSRYGAERDRRGIHQGIVEIGWRCLVNPLDMLRCRQVQAFVGLSHQVADKSAATAFVAAKASEFLVPADW